MIAIVCTDDNNGMMFNKRRQSKDRKLREYILNMCRGSRIWMNSYSAKQFDESDLKNNPEINIDADFVFKASKGEYCFIEDRSLLPYEQWTEKIILCRWNRLYPSDLKFDIPLSEHGWKCIGTDEIQGSSHDKITIEVYEK